METAELQSWLRLIRAPGVGPVLGARLLSAFGSPQATLDASGSAWQKAGLPRSLHAGLSQIDEKHIAGDLRWLEGEGRGLITLADERYPERLKEIAAPPLLLFYQGDVELLSQPQIAIVGARAATAAGLETAKGFAAELSRRGLVITSGLALGIDGAAHRGAIEAQGKTIAVCATGLDRVYPARHRALAHEISANGVLISEFPPGTPPLPEHFPRRNRLISGLSLGVLVVEAAPESGSLITARLALEQGREVFAIPGSIHAPQSRGCHALIRQGAKLTETVHDVLEELHEFMHDEAAFEETSASPQPKLEPMQQRVLDALGFDSASFDDLVERTSLPLENLSSALLALELQGHIGVLPGGAYQRVR